MQKVSENQTDLRPPESNAALKLMNLPILVHPVITWNATLKSKNSRSNFMKKLSFKLKIYVCIFCKCIFWGIFS